MAKASRRVTGRSAGVLGLALMVAVSGMVSGMVLGTVLGMAYLWLSGSTKLPAGQMAQSEQLANCPGPSPPCPMSEAMVSDLNAQLVAETDAAHTLRWLANRSNCTPSSTASLMASCVAERLDKIRIKARLYKGMYDDLKNLDREYFRRLTEEGLVPMTTHVPK